MVEPPTVAPPAADDELDDSDPLGGYFGAPRPAPAPTLALPDMAMIADVLLMVVQAAVTSSLGPDAAWTVDERREIHAALARILKRLPISAVEKVGPFADVLALIAALAPWAMRVWMQRTFKMQAAAAMARAAATTAPPAPAAAPPPITPRGAPTDPPVVSPEVAALFGGEE